MGTNYVRKGANRGAASARASKHAQRTPLPSGRSRRTPADVDSESAARRAAVMSKPVPPSPVPHLNRADITDATGPADTGVPVADLAIDQLTEAAETAGNWAVTWSVVGTAVICRAQRTDVAGERVDLTWSNGLFSTAVHTAPGAAPARLKSAVRVRALIRSTAGALPAEPTPAPADAPASVVPQPLYAGDGSFGYQMHTPMYRLDGAHADGREVHSSLLTESTARRLRGMWAEDGYDVVISEMTLGGAAG